jgi:hypothetical protein
MSGAMAMIIELASQRRETLPPTGEVPATTWERDPLLNAVSQPLESMRAVTDQLQISTGRVLLHELFYLYAKMDVIQSLVRGAAPLYSLRQSD